MTALPRPPAGPAPGARPVSPVIGFPAAALGDRMPPANIEAERNVLAGCLMAADARDETLVADVASLLSPDDFFRDAHQVIFRSILVLHSKGVGVDATTVADDLERAGQLERIGGDDTLLEIACSIAGVANCRHHAEIVLQKATMRRVALLCAETLDAVYSNRYTSTDVVRKVKGGLTIIEVTTPSRDDDEFEIRDHPTPPSAKAFHGPIGAMVEAIDPYTEASLPAILLQMLTAFGSIVGHGPHWVHESTRHHLNLFACIVGPTALGRKGTGWGYVGDNFDAIDYDWRKERVKAGINSGEKLIEEVGDEMELRTGGMVRGVQDKRLLMYEPEFERILSVFTRQGDSLSVVLRQMWDHGDNGALSRKNPVTCTGGHISLIGHTTPGAIREQLSLAEVANGLGNRFLWCWSIRSKDLSGHRGGRAFRKSMIAPMLQVLRRSADFMRAHEDAARIPMTLDADAEELWRSALKRFNEPRPGHLGDMLVRGPAQAMRMAAIYAAADASFEIATPHLEAALELWDYCVRSVEFIFGDRLGDPDAEKLLKALKDAGSDGLPQSRIYREVFGANMPADRLGRLLGRMTHSGLIHRVVKKGVTGSSKPVTTWKLGMDLPTPPPPAINASNALPRTSPPEGPPIF
ncbi:DnaB-like helicase N-terminal domain-containing protein [Paludisphaera sp.]|uniref:DnaB-like helicase N-terminal domain-containing protein n=1 Tax=Paludisphaera sp. TaxID=2017432 RepID=UPI00301C7911